MSKKFMKKEIFICSICEESFAQKATLILHISSIHEGKKPCKCKFCDFTSAEKKALQRHFAFVHEENI